ncbi:HpcH/HpaI aldolase/citrate lyase family protein [Embleya sp. NPDC127516]|uniref:HpcH/HpaI aldolase/citrate lyase family protein n=1 Tax=Embleya sp. NPDC127516 TaxID=3363990 RepID=UPI003802E905
MTGRSWLYVPGDRPAMLEKALSRGADAVIVDLEDAVPASAKSAVRAEVARWLTGQDPEGQCAIWVRINSGTPGLVDARAVVAPALRGLVQAKCAGLDELRALHDVLTEREHETGIDAGRTQVSPLLEDAAAILAAPAIARAPRVTRLQVGEADLCADLGIEPGDDESELLAIRSRIVLASAAAGIAPPVAPVSTDYRDLDALRRSTERLRRLGYRSRACIHPDQLRVVHDVFTPSPEAVERAGRLVARFEAGLAAGQAVCVGDDGKMIDEAVVRNARRILAAGNAASGGSASR